ncbi:MAG: hypothetical protein ACRCUS_00970 [Anaerovoracaceae bacterium]
MSEDKNMNSGVLFPNEKKTKPNQPALKGKMDINGVSYWASAWRKLSKETGKSYISIALQEMDLEDAPTINGELHQVAELKSPKAPQMEGTITLSETEELRLVSWIKNKSADGTPFYSLVIDKQSTGGGDAIEEDDIFFGLAQTPEKAPEPEPEAPSPDEGWDDDIPF